ncbi:hypothetical protein BJY04DRAFT_89953 [Aspergillus karnatakaensis]|uniref:uncharacterized protein n=1 Tax=Aspergillus karnatakaensis TaxID=1810916 RepID=UPI003CCD9820
MKNPPAGQSQHIVHCKSWEASAPNDLLRRFCGLDAWHKYSRRTVSMSATLHPLILATRLRIRISLSRLWVRNHIHSEILVPNATPALSLSFVVGVSGIQKPEMSCGGSYYRFCETSPNFFHHQHHICDEKSQHPHAVASGSCAIRRNCNSACD